MSVRITDLPEASELNGSEVMPIVQNGVTRRTTLNFVNQAAPAALILAETQQVKADTEQIRADTEQIKLETQDVKSETQFIYSQTVLVKDIFDTQYLGAREEPPTTDDDGNPLLTGALYWSNPLSAMFSWNGTMWVAFSSAVASVNGQIGVVVLGNEDVGAAEIGSNSDITSLTGLTGDISSPTGLQFDTSNPSSGAVGKLVWGVDDGSLSLGLSATGAQVRVGQDVLYRVRNGTLGTLLKGTLVRCRGVDPGFGQILVEAVAANGTYSDESFMGLTTEDLNSGDPGFVTWFGRLEGLNTSGSSVGEVWADGDLLYASPTVVGGMTKAVPTNPNNRVVAGWVVKADPLDGMIFVQIRPRYASISEVVTSVAGRVGDVILTPSDVGLGNVDNVQQAPITRVISAGNGLSGGGDLSSDRSISLGTPSTLTTLTANSVTTSSHTHAVTFPVTSVAGKTGAVALVNADVGLGNVSNDAQLKIASNLSDLNNAATARTNLGLSTGATSMVTTSATDTTAGRLLKVGDFGVGGLAFRIPDEGSWNAVGSLGSGFYMGLNVSNAPTTGWLIGRWEANSLGFWGRLTVSQFTNLTAAGQRSWFRTLVNGTWSDWREIYNQGSILGTVSQSSGVPTGAIIERGSNANGEYVRFADGTQICTHNEVIVDLAITSAYGAFYRSSTQTWTLPAAFANAAAVVSAFDANGSDPFMWATRATGFIATTGMFIVTAATSSTQNVRVTKLAIGRWF